jgi:hypothetical protein
MNRNVQFTKLVKKFHLNALKDFFILLKRSILFLSALIPQIQTNKSHRQLNLPSLRNNLGIGIIITENGISSECATKK